MDKGYYDYPELAKIHRDQSQSTIKMDKGYYDEEGKYKLYQDTSQSTIKMDKGYYKLKALRLQF